MSSKKNLPTIRSSAAEYLTFVAASGQGGVEAVYADEDVWLSQKMMGELYGVNVRTVNEHLKNIFADNELEQMAVIRNFRITAADGKNYNTQHYNLSATIAVGYKVNSERAVQFRKWATGIIKEFTIKAYAMDDERLKNDGSILGKKYFEQQLARIREIRLSERKCEWDAEAEKWWFSVLDVVAVLTDQPDYKKVRNYWKWLKNKLIAEGSQLVSATNQLKLPAADGKKYLTDVADTEQSLRLIQSIPSRWAEPFKLWLAEVGNQRLDQLQDPELSIEQAMRDYKRLGYTDNWINQRLKSIEIRKELTDEWKKHGLQEEPQFAFLTDVIYKTWADKTAKEYKQHKGLRQENLRDNMTNKELIMSLLAELSTKEISEAVQPQTLDDHEDVAKRGGGVARQARLKLEAETGKKLVSPQNAKQLRALAQNPGKKAGGKTWADTCQSITPVTTSPATWTRSRWPQPTCAPWHSVFR
jgi:hypothetical protein